MKPQQTFKTASGIKVTYHKTPSNHSDLNHITEHLSQHKGIMLSSGIEYPGRYNRWELGFSNPPLEIIATKGQVHFKALNPRGQVILKILVPLFINHKDISITSCNEDELYLNIHYSQQAFSEEKRSKQPSVASPLRIINNEFKALKDNMLGLFGAFAYDMIFEFEPCELTQSRRSNDKLYHLFFADTVHVIDKQKEQSFCLSLEFGKDELNTLNTSNSPFHLYQYVTDHFHSTSNIKASLSDQDYAKLVKSAQKQMKLGNIFEVVYSRHFSANVSGSHAQLFNKLKQMNPSPYEFYCQLGDEQIIGTSPEMFVRCEGASVESCPISGTVRRGNNAMEDEQQIRKLLNSYKDEVELTMCTDVDRNDKARICEPDSIELISRRTIEKYVGLFHTVDHVKGKLREGYNGLDAFLSHMWAVTLTGSPKKHAIELIEKNEQRARGWYGGAIGCLGFNGDMSSTITIRTIHIQKDTAYYQSGATLVWDSEPLEEAAETITKATTFYKALNQFHSKQLACSKWQQKPFNDLYAIMIDHNDSFVHTLSSYFRRLGVKVDTYRANVITAQEIISRKPNLVIYSPGPGKPQDFKLPELISRLSKHNIAQFGVCLGLQGIVEAFGGKLCYLNQPHHGKTWKLKHNNDPVFKAIEQGASVAAYHSIIADKRGFPEDHLSVIAENEHQHIMAIKHKNLPIYAVQFHPESILTLHDDTGIKLVQNILQQLTSKVN